MHIVGALVGIHHFQIDQMPGNAELVADAIATQHVASHAGDIQSLSAAVALHDRGDLHRCRAFVLHPAQAQAALERQGNFGLHVGELLLDQLGLRQRPTELQAIHGVLASGVPAEFRRPQSAPGNAVAGGVQAGEWSFQNH